MSIVVVIFSFLTCSLLITLSSQNLFALITSYKDIKQQIETKRRKIEFIETQISAVNESVSDILDFRKRINKSEMDTVRYKSEIENEFFSIRKKMINEGLREIDLDEVSSINELKYFMNRPGFPGECFICELRLPDHRFRWKHNKLFLLLPEEYGPAFPA
ncbi:hypothetical protein ACSLOD_23340, partial [Escherichia coli]